MWRYLFLICTCSLSASNLPFGSDDPKVLSLSSYPVWDAGRERQYTDVALDCADAGIAHFTISLPKNLPSDGVPIIFIIAGRATGRESLQFIPNHGQYALIAYEYPEALKTLTSENALGRIFSVRKSAIDVPGQLYSILKWSTKRPWAAEIPPSLIGVSFGSFFIPAFYHIAQSRNFPVGPCVLAYGGADLYAIGKHQLEKLGPLKYPAAWLLSWLLRPIEPMHYLKEMQGEFLIVNGIFDEAIPEIAREKLSKALNGNKTIYYLETAHLNPQDTSTLLYLIAISREWLETIIRNSSAERTSALVD